jgi:hypothetical protein
MTRDMQVIAMFTKGEEFRISRIDALKLQIPAIRLVWEWETVDGEEQPRSFVDVDNPILEHVKDDLFFLKFPDKLQLPPELELPPQ